MTNDNKNRIECGLEVIALVIWAFVTIATCAAVWNYCKEAFPCVVAALLFIINGYAIYRKAKSVAEVFKSFINKGERK